MDDIYFYLIGGAIIAVFIVILNHKKQKNKVTDFLKDARGAEPVFMQAAVEKKLKTLKVALYGNNTGIQLQTATLERGTFTASENKKQLLTGQLNQLERDYAAKTISMKVYDEELHKLIMKLAD